MAAQRIIKHKRLAIWGVVLILTWLQADVWQARTPPWAAPDEPGHYLYVRLYAEKSRPPRPADISPGHWRALLDSLERTGWQQYVHPHQTLTPDIAHEPLLAASGLQIGQKPPGYYALAAAWLHALPHWRSALPETQLIWLRKLSLLLRLLTAAIALFLGQKLWPNAPQRMLALGLLVGLLPMVGFIGDSLNNDALSLAWGAAAFGAIILARSPRGWLLALGLSLAGPLLVDFSLLYLWPLLLTTWAFLAPRPRVARATRLLSLGALLLAGVLLLLPIPHRALGWRAHNARSTRRAGALYLAAQDDAPARISQTHSGKEILRRQGEALRLSVRYSGQGDALIIRLNDNVHQAQMRCPLPAQTQTCRQTFTLTPGSQQISVSVILPAGQATLALELSDASGRSLLINGDGHTPAPLGDPLFTWLEKRLPLPAGYFSRILSPGLWDAPNLLRYGLYAGFTWLSFWGDFGWLDRPYPWPIYLLLAAVTVAALWGLSRRHLTPPLPIALAAVLFILLQTWLPMLGRAWQPQGRYLFPALLPISLLLLGGWENLLPPGRRSWLPPILLITLTLLNLLAWRIVG